MAILEAWKANNGGVLSKEMDQIGTNTRAASAGLARAKTSSIPSKNLEVRVISFKSRFEYDRSWTTLVLIENFEAW